MTFWLHLDYGGSGQGFGGYGLGDYKKPCGFGIAAISKVLDVLDVREWEKLPGTPCRVEYEHSKVHRIGHFLKDQWVDLPKLAKQEGMEPDAS